MDHFFRLTKYKVEIFKSVNIQKLNFIYLSNLHSHTVLLRLDYTDSTTVVQDTLDPSGRDNNLKKHQCQRVFRSFRVHWYC